MTKENDIVLISDRIIEVELYRVKYEIFVDKYYAIKQNFEEIKCPVLTSKKLWGPTFEYKIKR